MEMVFCVENRTIVPYNTNMTRKPRKESGTGVYHVMMRGINRRNIFEEKSDCARFLETPAECDTKEPSPCVLKNFEKAWIRGNVKKEVSRIDADGNVTRKMLP
ncbi:MAG: hypothetical protein LBD95_05700 [Clostridiales Family XIII bacterium]|jgi:hypothetical protein|nr:hypothetical protein [Clostridiales Family XIII bacterium]